MNVRYHVELSEAERCGTHRAGGQRQALRPQDQTSPDSARGRQRAQRRRYCRCWWLSAARPFTGPSCRFVKGNLEAALNEELRAGADRKLTSNEEALLIATACSSPPEGRARWTLELLAGALVKLTDHDSLLA